MYYDHEDRRFNLVSGLLCGAMLGVGFALLVAPRVELPNSRAVRRSLRGWRRDAERGVQSLREQTRDAVATTLADRRKVSRGRRR